MNHGPYQPRDDLDVSQLCEPLLPIAANLVPALTEIARTTRYRCIGRVCPYGIDRLQVLVRDPAVKRFRCLLDLIGDPIAGTSHRSPPEGCLMVRHMVAKTD